jgi:DNA (cytosine-5)-methyltransferase 1
MKKIKAIDFFCSGGGMTCGITKAGINVIAGIDVDQSCEKTYVENNTAAKFICKDIFNYAEEELANDADITTDDDYLVFIGCSPCQYWSLINQNKKKAEKSRNLLLEFSRFVQFYRPGYVVVENVPGISKNQVESGLTLLLNVLDNFQYKYKYGTYKLNEYGVPQNRRRFSLIASRLGELNILPRKSRKRYTVRDFLGIKNGFPHITAGYKDRTSFQHSVARLSVENLNVVVNTPVGDVKSHKKRKTYAEKGFSDSYSRISWDKPAPTITTKFHSISNGRFIHPDENRGLSIREGATLQTFPKDYLFYGNQNPNMQNDWKLQFLQNLHTG